MQLLAEMKRRDVLVEICLTSNNVILGVRGSRHPFPEYLNAGVPVTLAIDHEGVSRIDLTNEYVRAAQAIAACAGQRPDTAVDRVSVILGRERQARMQWDLERAFHAYGSSGWIAEGR